MTNVQDVDLFATRSADRVRSHTDDDVQSRLDDDLVERVVHLAERAADDADAGRERFSRRIGELEQESDMERVLEANAAALAFAGTALGVLHSRRWLVAPAVVTAFLFQHALQGWCPPVPLFRRLGIRTRQEIDAERFVVKTLRGDFSEIESNVGPSAAARAALAAVSR